MSEIIVSESLLNNALKERTVCCSVSYLTVLLSQFADGVYLVLLMGLLEGYFVPLYNFFLTPENFDQKVKCDFSFLYPSVS